jgi:hypothetical protein
MVLPLSQMQHGAASRFGVPEGAGALDLAGSLA